MRIHAMRTLVAGAMIAMTLTACGGDEEPAATPAPAPTEATGTPTPEPTEATDMPTDDPATVQAVGSDLGRILADAEGRTLYLFEADTDGISTCYEDCAANWPPLTVEGEPTAGDGADRSLLGTTERDDGSIQVTYADQPLYFFATDQATGDTNGQGIGGVWFVVDPDGQAVK
jgi:predicted lipoprotein with Yx(FWY)xxD motif